MAYTAIDLPTDYFNTKLWTGDGNTTQAISGVGHQPDFVWIKNRNLSSGPNLFFDSVRGTNKALVSNNDNAEASVSGYLNSFDSDGFTVGNDGAVNGSGDTYCSWNWLAGGSASSNSDGSITSSVSANTTAGFSIVTYTGSGSNPATIGHGLGAVPQVMILKKRTGSSALEWKVYHEGMGNAKYLILDKSNAQASDTTIWNSTTPSSSVFTVGSSDTNNTDNYVVYCFAEKKGFSRFGSYVGNGSSDGSYIHLGFKAAYIMIKGTGSGTNWFIQDNKRNPHNIVDKYFNADSNAADQSADMFDITANGIKQRNTFANLNGSGSTYIYLAFAEAPFVSSGGIPTTAR